MVSTIMPSRWLAVLVAVLCSPAAHAACHFSGLEPTDPLPTRLGGQSFTFIASNECLTLEFSVEGSMLTKTPTPGDRVGSIARHYDVRLTRSEWNLISARARTISWTITGTDSAGVVTDASMTNELDSDFDGWTRTDGDVGMCDHDAATNPGVVEVCDGVDQNCNGEIDEGCGSDGGR
jgi:hypothetical protein